MCDFEMVEVYRDESIIALLECYEDVVYFHHDIFHWSKSTLIKLTKCVADASVLTKNRGYEELWSYFKPEQQHLYKFCKKYGFDVMSVSPVEILVMKEL